MKGTFRPGDLLTIEPVSLTGVRPGDVVVFSRQQATEPGEIVHRVVRRTRGGLKTRGDAMGCEDAWVIGEHNLLGRVFYKTRNNRVSRVRGGRAGVRRAVMLHLYWGLRRKGVRKFQNAYDCLKEIGLAHWVWKPRITRVMIACPDGPCVQYICNQRVVARYRPHTGTFECRKPWDLVVSSPACSCPPPCPIDEV